MAVSNFAEAYKGRYQDILQKTLVGKAIASTQLKADLKFGDKVHRFALNTDGVIVRDITRYADRTIDALTDSDETLDIDKQKGLAFAIDDWDELQAGPLQIGETAGQRDAFKLAQYIDGDIFDEVTNAYDTLDTGDISAADAGAGTPIALTTTNAVQVYTTLQAKLRSNNVTENGNMSVVLDPYHAAVFYQTIIGKELSLSETVLKNGYAGPILGYKTRLSNNMKANVTLTISQQVSESDTVTIAGVTFTFNATPSGAGSVDIGSDAQGSLDNLIVAINGGAVGTTYIALSAADRAKLVNARITAVKSGTTLLNLTGFGRFTYAEALTHASNVYSLGRINSFAGKEGSIELVLQQEPKVTERLESKQRTTNVMVDALYGKKTFSDGKQNFLNLQLAM